MSLAKLGFAELSGRRPRVSLVGGGLSQRPSAALHRPANERRSGPSWQRVRQMGNDQRHGGGDDHSDLVEGTAIPGRRLSLDPDRFGHGLGEVVAAVSTSPNTSSARSTDLRTVADVPSGTERSTIGREKVAAFGTIRRASTVSPTCTHLGVHRLLQHRRAVWDCPCHGSRSMSTGGTAQDRPRRISRSRNQHRKLRPRPRQYRGRTD